MKIGLKEGRPEEGERMGGIRAGRDVLFLGGEAPNSCTSLAGRDSLRPRRNAPCTPVTGGDNDAAGAI